MCDHTLFVIMQITKSDMRPHAKCSHTDNADGHFDLPQGFVWVCMGSNIHLSPLRVPAHNGTYQSIVY